MNKEIIHAKFHGFQLGIEISKQLADDGKVIDLNDALKMARSIADGEITTTDPENSGRGLDAATKEVSKNIALGSIDAQSKHARDVCEGIASIVDQTFQDE